MKKLTLLFAAFAFCTTNVYSQVKETKRIKLENDCGGDGIINLNDNGLATVYNDSKEYVVTFYDNELNDETKVKIKQEGVLQFDFRYYYDSILKKVLLHHGSKKAHFITVISPENKKAETIMLKADFNYREVSSQIENLQNCSFMTVNRNGWNYLCNVNIETGEVKKVALPQQWEKRDIKKLVRLNSNHILVLYKDENFKKNSFRNFAIIDDEEHVISDNLIKESNYDFPIIDFNVSNLGNDEFIVSGIFCQKSNIWKATGIFVAYIEKWHINSIEFKEFLKIKNFFDNYNEENLSQLQLTIVVHPAIKLNDKIIITMEISKPCFRRVGSGDYSTSIFIGNKYFNALVISTSQTGEINSVQSVPLEISPYPFTSFIKIKSKTVGEKITFFYFDNKNINSFTLEDDDDLVIDKPRLHEPFEEMLTTTFQKAFDIWYDKYYFSYQWDIIEKNAMKTKTTYYLVKYEVE